jgi:hypothetical protein
MHSAIRPDGSYRAASVASRQDTEVISAARDGSLPKVKSAEIPRPADQNAGRRDCGADVYFFMFSLFWINAATLS